MKIFYWIVLGGGASGLDFCNRLVMSGLRGNILLIEKNKKDVNDRTWCYWSMEKNLEVNKFDISWKKSVLRNAYRSETVNLFPFTYKMIRSKRYYEDMYARISQSPQVTIKYESVQSLEVSGNGVHVQTDVEQYHGNWVFNSLPAFAPIPSVVHKGLKQHFVGHWIEAEKGTFEPQTFTLMDFDVPQEGGVQFVYVLPVSSTRALIEYTVFSNKPWQKKDYETKIANYLRDRFNLSSYEVVEKEAGVIPMSPVTFPRISQERIIHIGTAGGLTKASTGYTFQRIQEDSKRLVKDILTYGRPFPVLQATGRFAFYDRLLIWLIQNRPKVIPEIMVKLFQHNPARTFRFLSEKTSLLEEISLFFRLPWLPFLTALWYEYVTASIAKPMGSIPQSNHFDLPSTQLASRNQSSL